MCTLSDFLEQNLNLMEFNCLEQYRLKELLAPIMTCELTKIKQKLLTEVVTHKERCDNSDITLLKKFFRKVQELGHIKASPMSRITYHIDYKSGFFLETETLWQIFNQFIKRNKATSDKWYSGGSDAFLLVVGLGQHIQSVVNVKVKDINLAQNEITINNKPLSFDFISPPFRERLIKRLTCLAQIPDKESYIVYRKSKIKPKHRYAIFSYQINSICKRLLIKNVTPMTLRFAYFNYMGILRQDILSYILGATAKSDIKDYHKFLKLTANQEKKSLSIIKPPTITIRGQDAINKFF